MRNLLLALLLLLASCSTNSKKSCRIGIDPSFYPLELPGIKPQVYGFSRELMLELTDKHLMNITEVSATWDNLESELLADKYDAIFTSMPRYNYVEKIYDFSDSYLYVGPVFMTRQNTPYKDLKSFSGKEVAYIAHSPTELVLAKNPEILARAYLDIPTMLQALSNGKIEGAILPSLLAIQYQKNLYSSDLQVLPLRLTEESLRLVTRHNKHAPFRTAFNKAIKKLKADGTYNKLLERYDLKSIE